MKATPVLLCAALTIAAPPALGGSHIATILGEDIARDRIAGTGGESGEGIRLQELVWRRVSRHYIEHRGLTATEAEIAEAAAYHREFETKDRAQRARKLADLDRRLAADGLKPEERAHLVEFRAVLKRMAARDAESDQAPAPDPARRAQLVVPWIELWKMNRALYEQYGGVVALTRFGPDPHGARAALIADYERRGLLRLSDSQLRERLFARLAARPSMVVPPESVDFTPYWKKPITPSYFPD